MIKVQHPSCPKNVLILAEECSILGNSDHRRVSHHEVFPLGETAKYQVQGASCSLGVGFNNTSQNANVCDFVPKANKYFSTLEDRNIM